MADGVSSLNDAAVTKGPPAATAIPALLPFVPKMLKQKLILQEPHTADMASLTHVLVKPS